MSDGVKNIVIGIPKFIENCINKDEAVIVSACAKFSSEEIGRIVVELAPYVSDEMKQFFDDHEVIFIEKKKKKNEHD